ncbi:MAG: tRNA (5-methylaminomethyl-2-thiouridine)(34)-methyltransferase MnmD [Bacteroidales bacterium]|jgi:tRNA U34 5-methylaminomethyl-2-thiouridine-forming methyltransferase MnmC|nr:tRNA (5-methylaminomethyl-2-thiouridine)(34)-methyltransferase MnmD [Bacteroidales bacterium]
MNRIVKTADGSDTIFVPELDEHYHSVYGAINESEHIFIKAGLDQCKADPLRIFEAGFGTGLNAFLTLLHSEGSGKKIQYTSIEKYPLDPAIVKSLNYPLLSGDAGSNFFNAIHEAPWEKQFNITGDFSLLKIKADLTDYIPDGAYDLIYFDAFGPGKQPEMWTPQIFDTIASVTVKDGIFVTYSARGEVKRNLIRTGFKVSLLPGPPGKRQFIRAVKC